MGEYELASRYHYLAKTILVQSEGNTWAEDSLIITPTCQQATVPALWQHLLLISSRHWPRTLLYYDLSETGYHVHFVQNQNLNWQQRHGNFFFPATWWRVIFRIRLHAEQCFRWCFWGKTFSLSCWLAAFKEKADPCMHSRTTARSSDTEDNTHIYVHNLIAYMELYCC